jgi:heme-degrading monooxygenase HmoA
MIARIWRGNTRAAQAEEYGALVERTGIPDYRATPGNRGALLLSRIVEDTAEFVVISFWEDFDAIRRFAGPQPEKAVYYPEDESYLLGKEPHVTHFEVAPGTLPEMVRFLAAQEVAPRA